MGNIVFKAGELGFAHELPKVLPQRHRIPHLRLTRGFEVSDDVADFAGLHDRFGRHAGGELADFEC